MVWTDAYATYAGLGKLVSSGGMPDDVATWLNGFWSKRNEEAGPLHSFAHGSAEYLYELPSRNASRSPRTLGAHGFSQSPHLPREAAYQGGFPLPASGGRQVDRGHLMPHSAAGLYGPNLFRQDRALNRGLSEDGRQYRRLERNAAAQRAFYFCALRFCDDSDFPAVVETGAIIDMQLEVRAFRNRFDAAAIEAYPYSDDPKVRIDQRLAELASSAIGDVGEETIRAYFEAETSVQIVAMGDARMQRQQGRQDLDLVAVIDDEIVAIEVKARYHSGVAGTLTRAGNLRRPRLRRGRPTSTGQVAPRQSSRDYVAARVDQFLDRVDGQIDARVYLVDLRRSLLQWFPVTESGRLLHPPEPPKDCSREIEIALAELWGDEAMQNGKV